MNKPLYPFSQLTFKLRASSSITRFPLIKHFGPEVRETNRRSNLSSLVAWSLFVGLVSTGGANAVPLSQQFPGDVGISSSPDVLLHDDFETGWGRWNSPANDTKYLSIKENAGVAHSGNRYLDSTVTFDHLDENQYISASPKFTFANRENEVFLRFYVKFPQMAPPPHHWIRFSAGDENYFSSGLANTVPDSDEGFWFDFDLNINYENKFYVYWHEMRSGRCNDGSATPGCEGDQGTTYYYGNNFKPLNQTSYEMDQWYCIEISAKTNQVGSYDGELRYWVNDNLIGEFGQGFPEGTWLRDTFYVDGCSYSSCDSPSPFEGFNFRTSTDVRFKQLFLDAYYQKNTSENKRNSLINMGYTVSDNQTILYDDVVLATSRIGCKTNSGSGVTIPKPPVVDGVQ